MLIDTAGRLHTKTGLMDELGKVKRVVVKQAEVDEVLLVLDATTGQNGLIQARVFGEVVDVTGIVLTKLDGTAKGGIVFRVQRELGVPVKLVGLGEGADDLAPFEPAAFVDALLGVTHERDSTTLEADRHGRRNASVTAVTCATPFSRSHAKHQCATFGETRHRRVFPPAWPDQQEGNRASTPVTPHGCWPAPRWCCS